MNLRSGRNLTELSTHKSTKYVKLDEHDHVAHIITAIDPDWTYAYCVMRQPRFNDSTSLSGSTSPDGEHMIGYSMHTALDIIETKTGRIVGSIEEGNNIEFDISVSWRFDGAMLAVAQHDYIHVWNMTTKSIVYKLQPFILPYLAVRRYVVRYHPRSYLLACMMNDGAVEIWDTSLERPCVIHRLSCFTDLEKFAWHPYDEIIAMGSLNGEIKIWNTRVSDVSARETPVAILSFNNMKDVIHRTLRVLWHPQGCLLTSVLRDGTIHIWNTHTRALVHVLRAHIGKFQCAQWNLDGSTLICTQRNTNDDMGELFIWNMNTATFLIRIRIAHATHCEFTQNGLFIVHRRLFTRYNMSSPIIYRMIIAHDAEKKAIGALKNQGICEDAAKCVVSFLQ